VISTKTLTFVPQFRTELVRERQRLAQAVKQLADGHARAYRGFLLTEKNRLLLAIFQIGALSNVSS